MLRINIAENNRDQEDEICTSNRCVGVDPVHFRCRRAECAKEHSRRRNVPKETRGNELLLDKNWPFEGEGVTVQQEDGPKK